MQDDSNSHAVILETSPGFFAYVPLNEAPKQFSIGSNVKIEQQKISRLDGDLSKPTNINKNPSFPF